MRTDFIKLHIGEALSEVANNYTEEYLDEVVKTNIDQLVKDITYKLYGYFTRNEWSSLEDAIYTMLLDEKTLNSIVNVIKGMIVVQSFNFESK